MRETDSGIRECSSSERRKLGSAAQLDIDTRRWLSTRGTRPGGTGRWWLVFTIPDGERRHVGCTLPMDYDAFLREAIPYIVTAHPTVTEATLDWDDLS